MEPDAARPEPFRALDWPVARADELLRLAAGLWLDRLRDPAAEPVVPHLVERDVRAAVALPIPDAPLADEEIARHLADVLERYGSRIDHPRFLAYVCGSGTAPSAVAGLLAAGLAQNTGGWMFAAGAHEVEHAVSRWLASGLGLPETAGGIFLTGSAYGNMMALKLARDAVLGPETRADGLREPVGIYTSEHGHDTIARGADVVGMGSRAVRTVAVDPAQRLRPDALRAAVEADLAAGVRPLAVVASAGTTATGAVDPLAACARVAREHGLWFHVDGAYGGPAALSSRLRPLFAGIEEADSVTLDGHKWLYTAASASVLLARDFSRLVSSFAVDPTYVYRGESLDGEGLSSGFYGPNFSKPFDALKIWLSLLAFGRDAIVRRIEHDVDLAAYLGRRVAERADFELVTPPSLSVCCFRYRPADVEPGPDGDAYLDALNRALVLALQRDGRTYPSNAVVDGRFALRACIVNVRTEADDLDLLLDVAAELGGRLDRERRPARR